MRSRKKKMALSFYCDDTNPYVAPPEAFGAFLDYVAAEGIAGEASVILGFGAEAHGSLSRPRGSVQRDFIAQAQRAFECGVDAHMEVMTHGGLYDFEMQRVPEAAVHEGLWLHEPAVSVAEYESYFRSILDEGAGVGVQFTGLTWPGCGCEPCLRRYGELRSEGVVSVNPSVYQALLNLAKAGRFRGRTVPCFIHPDEADYGAKLVARDGDCGVYDLVANAGDWLGSWENNPARVNADYYISADGRAGRIVELAGAGAPYCLFYAHWQGLNPANGVGWRAFTAMVERVRRFLGDEVVWMRPSEFTDLCHRGGTVA
jgi:hypothetical protein